MAKFKIGDKVIIKEVNEDDITVGINVGMIATVLEESKAPYLKIDNWDNKDYDCYGIDPITGIEFDTVCWAIDENMLEKIQ